MDSSDAAFDEHEFDAYTEWGLNLTDFNPRRIYHPVRGTATEQVNVRYPKWLVGAMHAQAEPGRMFTNKATVWRQAAVAWCYIHRAMGSPDAAALDIAIHMADLEAIEAERQYLKDMVEKGRQLGRDVRGKSREKTLGAVRSAIIIARENGHEDLEEKLAWVLKDVEG